MQGKITPEEYKKLIDWAYTAHQEKSIKAEFRQNGKVPFVIHPTWAALTLLSDTRIPFEEREIGFQALLLHDVLEDTSAGLPPWVDDKVAHFVRLMTHDSWEDEQNITGKPPIVLLMKLCDKLHTMYEETLRPDPTRRHEWKQLMLKLLEKVKENYGNCRIAIIARAVLDETPW